MLENLQLGLENLTTRNGVEPVHIVSGVRRDKCIDRLLANAGIEFTHYFSIVEELETLTPTLCGGKACPMRRMMSGTAPSVIIATRTDFFGINFVVHPK